MKSFISIVMVLFLCVGCSTLTPTEKEFDEAITTYPTLKRALRKDPEKVDFINVTNYADTIFPNDDLLKFKNLKGLRVRGVWKNSFKHPEFRPVQFKIDTNKLKEMRSLEYLEFTCLDLRSFPTGLGVLKNLKGLEISFCGITELPLDVIRLKRLKILSLPVNNLSHLPTAIKEMDSLEVIELDNNSFQNIPEVLFTATQISKVGLANRYARPQKSADFFEVHGNDIDFTLDRNNPIALIDSARLSHLAIQTDNCEENRFVKDSHHQGVYKPILDFYCYSCNNCGALERWWNGETIFLFE